mgnify:FL=1
MSEAMIEILDQVIAILLPAVATLLAGWLAVVGNKIKSLYTEKVNTQIKKDVVDATVTYVQQVYKALNGEEKLEKAIDRASVILTEKGIPISEAELTMLIESAVYGLKQGWLYDPATESVESVAVEAIEA